MLPLPTRADIEKYEEVHGVGSYPRPHYRCELGHDMVLRCGAINARHIAHVGNRSFDSGCTGGETVEHLQAKIYFMDFFTRGGVLEAVRYCACWKEVARDTLQLKKEERADDEYPLGTRKFDVGLGRGKKVAPPRVGLEVWATHRTEEIEARRDRDVIRWYEFVASDVVEALGEEAVMHIVLQDHAMPAVAPILDHVCVRGQALFQVQNERYLAKVPSPVHAILAEKKECPCCDKILKSNAALLSKWLPGIHKDCALRLKDKLQRVSRFALIDQAIATFRRAGLDPPMHGAWRENEGGDEAATTMDGDRVRLIYSKELVTWRDRQWVHMGERLPKEPPPMKRPDDLFICDAKAVHIVTPKKAKVEVPVPVPVALPAPKRVKVETPAPKKAEPVAKVEAPAPVVEKVEEEPAGLPFHWMRWAKASSVRTGRVLQFPGRDVQYRSGDFNFVDRDRWVLTEFIGPPPAYSWVPGERLKPGMLVSPPESRGFHRVTLVDSRGEYYVEDWPRLHDAQAFHLVLGAPPT